MSGGAGPGGMFTLRCYGNPRHALTAEAPLLAVYASMLADSLAMLILFGRIFCVNAEERWVSSGYDSERCRCM